MEVIPLPMPAPLFHDGDRLPASYANFYISNGAVIVPTFNDPNDRIALGILGELFKDRPVVGIHAVDLVLGFGTLVELASSFYTLLPGDIILTGTPEGVGPVRPGDVMEAAIDGIGQMRVEVRAA